jgi:hypothetical protein
LLRAAAEEARMPDTLRLDDERDPLADDDEVIDAADEDEEEFEDDEDEDDEEEEDIEARSASTAEVGSEGGSPGESTETGRPLTGTARGSEATETLHRGTPVHVVERRDEEGRLIKRAP